MDVSVNTQQLENVFGSSEPKPNALAVFAVEKTTPLKDTIGGESSSCSIAPTPPLYKQLKAVKRKINWVYSHMIIGLQNIQQAASESVIFPPVRLPSHTYIQNFKKLHMWDILYSRLIALGLVIAHPVNSFDTPCT